MQTGFFMDYAFAVPHKGVAAGKYMDCGTADLNVKLTVIGVVHRDCSPTQRQSFYNIWTTQLCSATQDAFCIYYVSTVEHRVRMPLLCLLSLGIWPQTVHEVHQFVAGEIQTPTSNIFFRVLVWYFVQMKAVQGKSQKHALQVWYWMRVWERNTLFMSQGPKTFISSFKVTCLDMMTLVLLLFQVLIDIPQSSSHTHWWLPIDSPVVHWLCKENKMMTHEERKYCYKERTERYVVSTAGYFRLTWFCHSVDKHMVLHQAFRLVSHLSVCECVLLLGLKTFFLFLWRCLHSV